MIGEQPDTAAIRAARTLFGYGGVLIPDRDVEALCDALDAARAERDAKSEDWYISNRAFRAQWDRAEAAEAELARVADDYAGLMVRCKAAEARINELEADITVIDDLASGDRAQMRADLKHAETVSANRLNKVDELEARLDKLERLEKKEEKKK